ncbi:hypothetical protein ANAEL_04110 [Anaerolineales bacterium]|nr:hypothetical protein ANAEL_04110 [Anaerolineales bacterium]
MKSQYRMLFAFIGLLLVVGLACGAPTPTPTQSPATEAPPLIKPTEQPQSEEPSPVPTEPPVEQSSAQDFFTEEFDGDISNWTYFTTKNDSNANDSGVAPTADNGYLTFNLGKNLNVYAMYDPFTYSNVRLDVRADNRGTNNNNINLVCRYSDEGWYEIAIANNGLYWLWAFDAKKGYVKLADGGSNKIKSGKEINDYTFICSGRNLSLQINGFDTVSYTDNQYAFREGQIGVGASSFRDVPVKVEFDWVKISEP